MCERFRLLGLVALLGLASGADALACGDKYLVSSRGTRYQRPKNARAASVLIYSDPASGLPAALRGVPVDAALKREGHRSTFVETLDQLAAVVAKGGFDVVLAASSAVASVEKVVSGTSDAPVVVAFCVKPDGTSLEPANQACGLKAPAKERALLEAIDRAVLQRDKNARRQQARS